jgi:hypothetical protein
MPRTAAKSPQKGAKRGLYTPEPEQARVIEKHFAGHSNRSIARERGMDPKTVGRIISQQKVKDMIDLYRRQLLSLVSKAIDVYSEALRSDDERIRVGVATKLVEGLHVMPRGNEQISDMADEASARQKKERLLVLGQIVDGMLTKSDTHNIPLPPPVAELKAKLAAKGKKGDEENNPAESLNLAEKKPARKEEAYKPDKVEHS